VKLIVILKGFACVFYEKSVMTISLIKFTLAE